MISAFLLGSFRVKSLKPSQVTINCLDTISRVDNCVRFCSIISIQFIPAANMDNEYLLGDIIISFSTKLKELDLRVKLSYIISPAWKAIQDGRSHFRWSSVRTEFQIIKAENGWVFEQLDRCTKRIQIFWLFCVNQAKLLWFINSMFYIGGGAWLRQLRISILGWSFDDFSALR